ncbi:hypothetical protein B0H14DRAFT_3475180 [Mycena olivaceomarginata]|nr:hypothetical protein B0H14DRAFT_3475180 [Mycena olivaceomarginata]
MRLLGDVWDKVTRSTIANYGKHTQICPKETDKWEDIFVDSDAPDSDMELDEDNNVQIDVEAAPSSSTTDTVMDAEDDTVIAREAVLAMMPNFSEMSMSHSRTDGNRTALPPVLVSDCWLKETEKDFVSDVLPKLHKERCIRGEDTTLDKLLDPLIEQEDICHESPRFYFFARHVLAARDSHNATT